MAMKFSKLNEILFGAGGACISEDEKIVVGKLQKAEEELKNMNGADFTKDDYITFINIFARFTFVCRGLSGSAYSEVFSEFYGVMLETNFYDEVEG